MSMPAARRTTAIGTSEPITIIPQGSIAGRRFAVASAEPEDAGLTGMTRSLERRLLALNLQPYTPTPARKVA